MSEGPTNNHIHLPNLSIKGFRGIDDLSIPRLGRVTLLTGENGVGKTTVLEACRVYAARGRHSVLSELARGHEEYSAVTDEDGDRISIPDMEALFHGRDSSSKGCIEIGPENGSTRDRLRIEVAHPSKKQAELFERMGPDNLPEGKLRVLKTIFQGREYVTPWLFARDTWSSDKMRSSLFYRWQRLANQSEPPPEIECVSIGPGLMPNDAAAAFWDNVAMQSEEAYAVEALQLVLGNTVESVVMVGDTGPRSRLRGRRPVVKLRDHDRRVPLKSLGDGATRLFGVALALANSRKGLLLIDEAENGIHYSVQRDFWHMVLQTAHENNFQVLATTHSWDCITGFARAAKEIEGTEGVLVRLEKENKGVRATEYSESELETSAEQGIEVR